MKSKLSKIKPTLEVVQRHTIHKDQRTYVAGMLANLGIGTKTIAMKTGLKPGSISYRLRCAGVRISDYRTGRSETAQYVMQHAERFAQQDFTAKLRDKLKL